MCVCVCACVCVHAMNVSLFGVMETVCLEHYGSTSN